VWLAIHMFLVVLFWGFFSLFVTSV